MDIEKSLQAAQRRPGRHVWVARIPFVIAAILGMVLIVGLKFLEIDQTLVTAAAIVCLLG